MPRFRKGKRNKKRTKMVVPVRMWVTGTSGSQESHLAHTLDASDYGVKLAGFHGQLKVGEVIEIQYRQKRARFRVVWIRSLDNSPEKQLGAECIEPKKNIWTVEFADETDEYQEKE